MLFFGYKERFKKIVDASKRRRESQGFRSDEDINLEEYKETPLEKNDLLALVLSAFIVFLPVILVLLLIIVVVILI